MYVLLASNTTLTISIKKSKKTLGTRKMLVSDTFMVTEGLISGHKKHM